MSCGRYRELLSRYVDDALTARERDDLMAHLRECPACAARLARYRQASLLIERVPESEPSPHVRAAVLAQVGRPVAAVGVATARRWLAVAAVGLVAIAGALLWPRAALAPAVPTAVAGQTPSARAEPAAGVTVPEALQAVVGGPSHAYLPSYLPQGASVERLTVDRPTPDGNLYDVDLALRTEDGNTLRLRQSTGTARSLPPPVETRRVMIEGREWRYLLKPANRPGEKASHLLVGEVNGARVELESSLPLDDLVKVAGSLR